MNQPDSLARSGADGTSPEALAAVIYSAVVADVLDTVGYREQVIRTHVHAVAGCDRTLVGRARTARAVPVDTTPEQPYALLLDAIDALRIGDVLVIDAGGVSSSGLFGGLLATAVSAAGAVGAVINGGTRDLRELRRLDFPTYALGVCPADSLGRDEVVERDAPVTIGSVRIASGDLLVADLDGIVVVPHAIEHTVINLAVEKVTGENHVRQALADGMKASEAFARYGIL